MADTTMKVLVVDDFATMRRIVKNILTQLGYKHIIEADDGVKAWEIINEKNVDVIICDWNMPNMKGIDLLRKVRADKKFSELPFVMVTAEGKKENVIEATKAGVTGFIIKPFTAKDLGKKLKMILEEE